MLVVSQLHSVSSVAVLDRRGLYCHRESGSLSVQVEARTLIVGAGSQLVSTEVVMYVEDEHVNVDPEMVCVNRRLGFR